MCAVLQRIASLANGLTKAELHVLLALAARAEVPRVLEVRLSSRELARQTGLARSSVQEAIDSLNQKVLIRSDAPTNSFPAVHFLICLASVETEQNVTSPASEEAWNPGQAGAKLGPEAARKSGHGGLTVRPEVDQFSGQGGLNSEPEVDRISAQGGSRIGPGVAPSSGQSGPNFRPAQNEKSAIYEASHRERTGARVDSIEKDDLEKIIDRLQKAQKTDYEEDLFELARNQIASHHAKFARLENRIPNPPDDRITTQFLAVAEWPKLSEMLCNLASERKEAGHSYAWYVTVAVQRIHGISPEQVRQIRAGLRKTANHTISSPFTTQPKAEQMDEPVPLRRPLQSASLTPDLAQLQRQIRSIAAAKSMR